ncbi:OsmC family protein [Cellulomonas cellasea]|uniref:OsmC family protein n=1 Tax=Cellulomonas cellasea TaxID=43670 RepID=UPI0025A4A809|nr:OsmC family protein [Cellulomonas cellasea]MDM8083340.1 OsmC family protein [Cellulomonas cellasea]
MTTDQASQTTPSPTSAPAELWVERTGRRTYTGRSSRGAEVLIGPVEAGAVFTPGELLKIALAGCTGMSADTALAHRLGDDVAVTVEVEGPSDPDEDRYPVLTERLVVDLSSLDAAQRERLLTVVHRAVDNHCTVGRTLTHGATVELTVEGER